MIGLILFPGDWILAILAMLGGSAKKSGTIEVIPIPDDEKKKAEFIPEDTYLEQLEDIIRPTPTPNSFYQMAQGGPTASELAAMLLDTKGANTGSNRVALIKCLARIPWNLARYTSTHPAPKTWGTLYNLEDGSNLSVAWFPRHAPAAQLLAVRQSPPRTISSSGALVGSGSYYALLWLPPLKIVNGSFICEPESIGPPKWLLDAIGGS